MNTVYRFPDGVIRWAGENPSNRSSCMFYELDSAGLNLHEMNRTAENMDILISAILKGATVNFPAAKKSERIARNQIRTVQPKDQHTIVLNGNKEIYTLGSVQELLPLFGVSAAPQQTPVQTPHQRLRPSQPQPALRTPQQTQPHQRLRTPQQPKAPASALKTPVTPPAGRGMPQKAVRAAAPLMSQTIKVSAPKKSGTLSIHMPEKNARMLGAAVKALGGFK